MRDVAEKVSGVLVAARDQGEPQVASPAGGTVPADRPDADRPDGDRPDPDRPDTDRPDTDRPDPDRPDPDREDTAVTSPPAATAPAADDLPAGPLSGPAEADPVAAAAVELARAAAEQESGGPVGPHLGVEVEQEGTVTHAFACPDRAYVGWRWCVTVARVPESSTVTIDEVVLLPGADALLAPAWVPWSERVRPGDLSPGDVLPPEPDDPRLVPGYADVRAERLPFELHRELGLGRPRVLSLDGRLDAAQRWFQGAAGPFTPMAKAAPADCGSCGFLVPLAGALGRTFGACANAMAADDGRVVALAHGCGAHSETVVDSPESAYSGMAVQDEEFELVPRPASAPEPAADDRSGVPAGADPAGVEPAGGIVQDAAPPVAEP